MRILFILALLVSLTSCNPIYEKAYKYSPPQRGAGSMCVNQCLDDKTYCESICLARKDSCRVDEACMESCESNHNICYTNCGGIVHETKECKYFCK